MFHIVTGTSSKRRLVFYTSSCGNYSHICCASLDIVLEKNEKKVLNAELALSSSVHSTKLLLPDLDEDYYNSEIHFSLLEFSIYV